MSKQDSKITKDIPNPAKEATDMSVARTVMAADRSLMAWVRTGLSLISFGFTIYKFLEYSREQVQASGKGLQGISSPKLIGLFMIAMGILSLVMGTVENVTTVRSLRQHYELHHPRYSLLMAAILLVFGIVMFLGIILRLRGIGTS